MLCILSVADQALDEKAAVTAAEQRPGLQKLKIENADIFEGELGQRSESRDQSSDADAQVSGFRFLNLP